MQGVLNSGYLPKPIFSVVIPAYNHNQYIGDTIQSVLNQTFTDFEIIIVNDGSTDDTEKVIQSFSDKRIRYYYQKNHDAPYTINRGIREAQGQYIAILNSDDIFEGEKLQNSLDYLCQGYEFVFGKIKVINEKNEEISADEQRVKWINEKLNKSGEDVSLKKLLLNINYFITTSNFVFKKNIIERVGYFHEKLHYSHDFDFLLRLFTSEIKIKFIPEHQVSYRMHSDNTLGKGKADAILELSYSIVKRLIEKNVKISKEFYFVPIITNTLTYILTLSRQDRDSIIDKNNEKRKKLLSIINYWIEWGKNFDCVNKNLAEKETEIIRMKNSKFWKLRDLYLKIKEVFSFKKRYDNAN